MKSTHQLFSYNSFKVLFSLFLLLTAWRIALPYLSNDNFDVQVQIWAATYQIIAWFGALTGILFSRSWGGYKSIIGRAALAFSIGLLAQSFGQSVFSYYFYTNTTAPYPSLADIGFFGSIPFYIYGAFLLAKASGVTFSLDSIKSKIYAFIIPIIFLLLSYIVFLKGYIFESHHTLKTVLDFGYPLGQAIYVSIAILAYFLSRKLLGGIMRRAIIYFLVALVAQYISDYLFLYHSSRGIFVGGGISDFVYFISYFIMSLSLIKLRVTFDNIHNS